MLNINSNDIQLIESWFQISIVDEQTNNIEIQTVPQQFHSKQTKQPIKEYIFRFNPEEDCQHVLDDMVFFKYDYLDVEQHRTTLQFAPPQLRINQQQMLNDYKAALIINNQFVIKLSTVCQNDIHLPINQHIKLKQSIKILNVDIPLPSMILDLNQKQYLELEFIHLQEEQHLLLSAIQQYLQNNLKETIILQEEGYSSVKTIIPPYLSGIKKFVKIACSPSYQMNNEEEEQFRQFLRFLKQEKCIDTNQEVHCVLPLLNIIPQHSIEQLQEQYTVIHNSIIHQQSISDIESNQHQDFNNIYGQPLNKTQIINQINGQYDDNIPDHIMYSSQSATNLQQNFDTGLNSSINKYKLNNLRSYTSQKQNENANNQINQKMFQQKNITQNEQQQQSTLDFKQTNYNQGKNKNEKQNNDNIDLNQINTNHKQENVIQQQQSTSIDTNMQQNEHQILSKQNNNIHNDILAQNVILNNTQHTEQQIYSEQDNEPNSIPQQLLLNNKKNQQQNVLINEQYMTQKDNQQDINNYQIQYLNDEQIINCQKLEINNNQQFQDIDGYKDSQQNQIAVNAENNYQQNVLNENCIDQQINQSSNNVQEDVTHQIPIKQICEDLNESNNDNNDEILLSKHTAQNSTGQSQNQSDIYTNLANDNNKSPNESLQSKEQKTNKFQLLKLKTKQNQIQISNQQLTESELNQLNTTDVKQEVNNSIQEHNNEKLEVQQQNQQISIQPQIENNQSMDNQSIDKNQAKCDNIEIQQAGSQINGNENKMSNSQKVAVNEVNNKQKIENYNGCVFDFKQEGNQQNRCNSSSDSQVDEQQSLKINKVILVNQQNIQNKEQMSQYKEPNKDDQKQTDDQQNLAQQHTLQSNLNQQNPNKVNDIRTEDLLSIHQTQKQENKSQTSFSFKESENNLNLSINSQKGTNKNKNPKLGEQYIKLLLIQQEKLLKSQQEVVLTTSMLSHLNIDENQISDFKNYIKNSIDQQLSIPQILEQLKTKYIDHNNNNLMKSQQNPQHSDDPKPWRSNMKSYNVKLTQKDQDYIEQQLQQYQDAMFEQQWSRQINQQDKQHQHDLDDFKKTIKQHEHQETAQLCAQVNSETQQLKKQLRESQNRMSKLKKFQRK